MPCRFDVMKTKVDGTFKGALQQLLRPQRDCLGLKVTPALLKAHSSK